MNYFHPRFRALDAMVYFFLFAFSAATAFLIQFEFSIPDAGRGLIASAVVLVLLVKPPVFYISGLDRNLRMFAEIRDLSHLFLTNAGASVLVSIAGLLYFGRTVPLT